MPCYHPLEAFVSVDGDTSGAIVFNRLPGRLYVPVPLPCGKCIGCRMDYARQWAIRCMHEAELHDYNCMVTLTYDNDHLPDDSSLRPVDVQLWLKRLRRQFPDYKIKYFLCGEYGDQFSRPHYHVLLFGIDFSHDYEYNNKDSRPKVVELQDTWTLGHVHVAPLNYEIACYVARYCTKKQEKEIDYCDKKTGVVLQKEFTRMSRRPGIAHDWIKKNSFDTYKTDTVVVNGDNVSRPPRYYDKVFKKINGDLSLDKIKSKRIEETFARGIMSSDKLAIKEKIAKARLALQKRRLEK